MTSPVRAETKFASGIRAPRRRTTPPLGFQLRILLPLIVYGLLFVALSVFFVWLPMQRQLAADPSPVVKALLAAQLFRIQLWLGTLLCISAGVASTYALLRARRIAAPVQELREHLAKLAVGDPQPLALAPGDDFRELEAPFNAVVSRVDHMTRSNLEMLRALRRNLEGIAQRSTKHQLNNADLQESIAALLRDIEAEIKKFQMKS